MGDDSFTPATSSGLEATIPALSSDDGREASLKSGSKPAAAQATHGSHQTRPYLGNEYHRSTHGFLPSGLAGGHDAQSTPLNMGDMSAGLPHYSSHSVPYASSPAHPRYYTMLQPGMVTMTNAPHFPAQANPLYLQSQQPQMQGAYPMHTIHHPQHGVPAYPQYLPAQAGQQGFHIDNPPPYYGQPYSPSFAHPGHPMPSHFPPQGNEHAGCKSINTGAATRPRQENATDYDVSKKIVDGSSAHSAAHPSRNQSQDQEGEVNSVNPPLSTGPPTPRGPPRKPKQSGHALWVGNLPPNTNVVDLKDHFAQGATGEIESVFLISKSNCAFVNYKSGKSCVAAMNRFHDARFQGVRLVCRLRRGLSTPGSKILDPHAGRSDDLTRDAQEEREAITNTEVEWTSKGDVQVNMAASRLTERFFIVKSLTVEDLELSKKSSIWTTQLHNEAALNSAFETADNVYLIFSANKSGEYFGYARMISPISDDEVVAMEAPPKPEISTEPELVNMTSTAATANAPSGRIIDDAARGTIFWEADSSESEEDDEDCETKSHKSHDDGEAGQSSQSLGKPFRIQWLCSERLPFYRTRGLRNPWNSNREVKIARDGTELEPTVGRKMIELFHTPRTVGYPSQ